MAVGGRLNRALLSAALLLALGPVTARADQGVAIDLGAVRIDELLWPGSSHGLPSIGVSNPGDEPGAYRMGVSQVEGQEALAVNPDWLNFDPPQFELQPGASQAVAVRLTLPGDAEPGRYEALLQAALAPRGEGALVGAAAAARLTFTVQPSRGLAGFLHDLNGFFVELAPWSYLIPGLVVVGFFAWRLNGRFRLRIERRR